MADRDWEQELAAIDRRLAGVPDAPPPPSQGPAVRGAAPARVAGPGTGTGAAPNAAEPARAGRGRAIGTPAPPGRRSWRVQLVLLAWVLLGTAVVAALIAWPYDAGCGAGLAIYLGLVAALGLAGVATSASAWRHRAPFVHLVGLAMVATSAVLGARQVLPRVGYAVPSPAVPAVWGCVAPAAGAPAPGV
jgi:hypothetical protein